MKEQEIKVVVIEVGKAAAVKTVKNELEALQSLVGGYVEETYPLEDESICVLCDEEGRLKGKSLSAIVNRTTFCGTIVFMGVDDEEGEWTSLTEEQIDKLLKEYNKPLDIDPITLRRLISRGEIF